MQPNATLPRVMLWLGFAVALGAPHVVRYEWDRLWVFRSGLAAMAFGVGLALPGGRDGGRDG